MFKRVKNRIRRIKNVGIQEKRRQIRWIYGYAKSHIIMIILYTVLGLSGTLIGLFTSLISRDLVDIITGHRTGELLITFVSMLGITLLSTVVGQVSSYLSTKISLSIENRIKAEVFDQIMETEWESLMQYKSGDLVVRWSGDVGSVASGILTLIPNFCIYIFQFASALYMVCKYDASFAIFALAGVPVSILISRESLKRMQKNNMGMLEMNSKITTFNQESFGNVQILKAFDLVPVYTKRLRQLQKEYIQVKLKYQKNAIMNAIFLTILSMLVTYSAQGWGIYKVWSGAITYGTMTMFLTLSGTLSGTVNNLIAFFPSSIQMTNAAKRLMEITGMPKEDYSQREEVREYYRKHEKEGVGIHLRDVDFAYRDGETVFSHVSIDANPREVVALVGPSGEGKTTMLRFILALIHGKEGAGYLTSGDHNPEDGDFMDLSASVRQLMAYVPQGNTMLTGTIAENMRNVKEDATDEEIIEALKMACAWKFVEKLPDGINTEIKERGGGFSEGQAQRLSIARALIRKSPILLLDEATSALDMATEKEVLRNIMKDSHARTCIVSTHRPSVLTVCDRVYSIHDQSCSILSKEEINHLISEF